MPDYVAVPVQAVPRAQRPGVVTAVGAASVAIGLLSIVASLVVLFVSFALLLPSAQRVTAPPLVAPAPAVPDALPEGTATVGGSPIVPSSSEDGLRGVERGEIVRLLSRNRAMNDERERQLELLLGVAGKKIFPFAVHGYSEARLKQSITAFGTLPGLAGGRGPDFFEIPTGRIDVYDDHATFRPSGSSDVVSVSAKAAPSTQMLPETSPAPVATLQGPRRSTGEVTAIVVSLIEALLSAALALMLLILGVLVLRDSRTALRLHWIYVLAKLPLAMIALLAGWWVWGSVTARENAAGFALGPGIARLIVVVLALLSVLYPLALIVVLRRRDVRNYF